MMQSDGVSEKFSASHLFPAMRAACTRGIDYLASTQERSGAWHGRWGCNYVYGTSHALCGLSYFVDKDQQVEKLVRPALQWLNTKQNNDGGWGESLLSYRSLHQGQQESTASQTAWALMGLLAHLPFTETAIERGVCFLISSQRSEKGIGSSWPEIFYTGTGFPNHFYLGYDYYRHYFPMMALGRYLRQVRD